MANLMIFVSEESSPNIWYCWFTIHKLRELAPIRPKQVAWSSFIQYDFNLDDYVLILPISYGRVHSLQLDSEFPVMSPLFHWIHSSFIPNFTILLGSVTFHASAAICL